MIFKNRKQIQDNHVLRIGITNPKKYEYSISDDDLTTSLIAFGATGSGKTSSVLLPALRRLVDLGHSGLVLDVKGDYVNYALNFASERATIIGASDKCVPINIIAGMKPEVFRSFLAQIALKAGDNFWGIGGIRDSMMLYYYYRDNFKRYISLSDLYGCLVECRKTASNLDDFVSNSTILSNDFINIYESALADPFGLLAMGASKFANPDASHRKEEQYAWHTATLLNSLRPFAENKLIRAKLCEGLSKINLATEIYDKKKVIFLDMPNHQYGEAGYTVSKILRERFFNLVFSMTPESRLRLTKDVRHKTFMLVDEYQNFINESSTFTTIDDNTWIDKSRSFGHINIFATQGISSLYAKASKEAVDSILQNIRTKIYLPTDDKPTLDHIEQYTEATEEFLYPKTYGSCFIYKGNVPSFAGWFTLLDYFTARGPITSNYNTKPETSLNKRHVRYNAQWCLICPKSSIVVQDFETAFIKEMAENPIAKHFIKKLRVIRLQGPENIENYAKALVEAFSPTKKQINLIIMRGGGDKESLDFYNDPQLVKTIRSLKNCGHIHKFLFSVGHAKNKFTLDDESMVRSTTPTDLGTALGKIMKA